MAVFVKMGAMVATVTVANDGSGNFNCNGTNDEVEIQAAIDHCEGLSQGGDVYIKEGVYYIESSIILKPGVTVFGAGHATRMELQFDGVMWDTANDQVNDHMGLHYMRMDGNRVARGAGTAIRLYGAYLSEFSSLHIHDFDDYGIYCTRETGLNATKQCYFCNIEMINAGIGNGGFVGNWFQDNRLENLGIGFQVAAAPCITVDNGGSGVMFNNTHVWADGAGAVTGMLLTANSFRVTITGLYGGGNNQDHLLSIAAGGWGHTVSGIVGEDTTVSCIEVAGLYNTVGPAFIASSNGSSVVVSGTYNNFSNINVRDSAADTFVVSGTDNTFSNCRSFSGAADGWYITGDRNRLTGCGSDYDNNNGFFLDGADLVSLTGCWAHESVTGHGASIFGSDKVTITGGHYTNNDAANKRGINFAGGSLWCSLNGAFLEGNDDYNVAIDATSDDGVIMGCRMDDAGMTGNIDDNSGGSWLIVTATDGDPLNELT